MAWHGPLPPLDPPLQDYLILKTNDMQRGRAITVTSFIFKVVDVASSALFWVAFVLSLDVA